MTNRKRDGALESVWQQTPSPTLAVNTLNTEEVYDAVVIGGGITGVTTAYLLQKAGKRVVLVEASNLGFGTTGGTTAHISTILDATYDELINDFGEENAKLVAEGSEEALNFLKSMCSQMPDTVFDIVPAYYYALDEKQADMLEKIVESSVKVGLSMQFVNESPFPINAIKVARVDNQGQFNPISYITLTANRFQELGGVLIENCRATGLDEGDTITVNTSISSILCRNVVYATHIPPGVNLLHFRNAPYRSYAIAVKLKGGEYPQALAYDLDDPYHYYRSMQIGDDRYLVFGGEDHKTGHEENALQHFTGLTEYLKKHYDFEEVSYKWSSQFYEPTDGLPYIGHLPGSGNNVYVATGFNGDGMTLGTLSAIVISDMITKGNSRYSKVFNPSRVKPVAGFSNFVKEAADVVANLIGGRFNADQIDSVSELANGEARIAKIDGHTLAMYRDENGKLHALSSACTHIKCTVGWNNAEKTWDCPCHGTRYNYDGVMVTGPARRDLEIIHPDRN